ncbi:MAG: hypothetical protein KDA45_13245, partial [Planctomycetales bacterium]|nr:hypothetical protein [Planctomycetales bacterium]
MPQPFAHALAWLGSVLPLALLCSDVARAAEGAQLLNFYGYHDCIQLSNDSTEVILCPAAGGRVLSYALEGANILYLPRGDEGWVWDGSSARAPMHAGRFDIGPEQMVPRRPTLWQGKWTGEIVGDRAAVLRSQYDASTGVQLERRFELAADSSKLECTQTIINASPQDEERTVEYCHWSRTFVNGYGTCVLPVSRPSRFPQFYVRYDPPNNLINFQPNDRHIQLVDDHLIINARPLNPKLGFDSQQGWLAYLSRQ